MNWYHYDETGALILRLYIQPGAKHTEVVGLHGDALKIKLAAVPVDGKANAVLLKFIAKCFDVQTSQVLLKTGEKSRRKLLVIQAPKQSTHVLYHED